MASAVPTSPPESGQLVKVRSRGWVLSEVDSSALPPPPLDPTAEPPQHLVSLLSVEDDTLGEELQVVWETEPGADVIDKVSLPEPTRFDALDRHDAFLDTVRWGAAPTADVRNIQAPSARASRSRTISLTPWPGSFRCLGLTGGRLRSRYL